MLKNLKNKQRMNDLIDILLKNCKEHGVPVTDMTDLNKLMKQSPKKDLKSFFCGKKFPYRNCCIKMMSKKDLCSVK